ncbi:MAG: tRNA 2-thiocytidine(32) synthetase TtcA [Clostridia bacterium]|nr:tRNA 2-thiocytidine(32) synthetase TtcA [Clostridia bacterium]MBQ4323092.1 tRNA 2-thiocytidine(32) synthetase TtcA [Clostridia bacterium]
MVNIVGHIRRAVQDYDMISEGDRIAVGVSGGKDSGALLFALEKLSHFYPKKFTLTAIIIDMGVGMDYSPLEEKIRSLGIECIRKETDIAKLIFEVRKEPNPCALCAVMRRGALNKAAVEYGCNKVALGHHYDDVLETFWLNLIHGGRLGCFQPVTYLDRMDVTVIRPMIYVEEKNARAYCKSCEIPVIENPCPANGVTQRQEMKDLMREMEKRYPGLRKRVFGAIQRSGLDEW